LILFDCIDAFRVFKKPTPQAADICQQNRSGASVPTCARPRSCFPDFELALPSLASHRASIPLTAIVD
jgi:hypothetical protein